jgi:hypothetical protein
VVQFGTNPHTVVAGAQSVAVKSPLLQFTATSVTPIRRSSQRSLATNGAQTKPHRSPVPLFYVTMPFNQPQVFNYAAIKSGKHTNYTIPACSLYKGGRYVSCGSCNITTLTALNVTYGCFNISLICPPMNVTHSPSISSRRLAINSSRIDGYVGVVGTSHGRLLAADANSGLGSETSSTELEGNFISFFTPSVSTDEFAVLLQAVGMEMAAVLSINPLYFDFVKALPVTLLATLLGAIVVIGTIMFIKWDAYERSSAGAVEYETKMRQLHELLMFDIFQGGSGVVENSDVNTYAKDDGVNEFIRELRSRESKTHNA